MTFTPAWPPVEAKLYVFEPSIFMSVYIDCTECTCMDCHKILQNLKKCYFYLFIYLFFHESYGIICLKTDDLATSVEECMAQCFLIRLWQKIQTGTFSAFVLTQR